MTGSGIFVVSEKENLIDIIHIYAIIYPIITYQQDRRNR